MKRMIVVVACAFVASLTLSVSNVDARPQYKKAFDKLVKGGPAEKAIAEAKCNTCHEGKKKTGRNAFGKALIKAGLTKDAYTKIKTDKPALEKHIKETFEKFMKAKESEKFKKNIEGGKLPADGVEE